MQFLQFDSLKNIPGLRHAITTRGGTESGPYDALNLAYHVGDDAARVTENRKALAQELGYDATRLVAAQQVHGIATHEVNAAVAGCGAFDWDSALPNCDALIVTEPQIPILIQVADCAPILIIDASNHVLAVVHAGWRGAVARICRHTLREMNTHFRTRRRDVFACIGPCLCEECFEVGPEVETAAEQIAPESIADPLLYPQYVKPHLDLRLLIKRDLLDASVPEENIEIMPHCPRCQNDLLFSHRGQNGTAGRFGFVAWWEA